MAKATFRDFYASCVYGYPHVSYAQQTRKDLFDKTLPTYLVNNGLPNILFGDFKTDIDPRPACLKPRAQLLVARTRERPSDGICVQATDPERH